MKKKNGLGLGLVVMLLLISMPLSTSVLSVSVSPRQHTILAQDVLEIDSDFTLTEDLWDTSIQVTSDKVVIDGNGYTLHGPESGVAVIADDREKVTIKNLGIEGWAVGILFIDCNKNKIVDNIVTACVYGIALVGCGKSDIKRNTVQDCSWIGFYLRDSTNNRIADNIALRNTEMGFGLEGYCLKNRYVGNTATESSHAIWMGPDSLKNIFTLNVISTCIDGIHLSGSRYNKLIENTITRCGNGILTMGASENWLEGNVINWPLGEPDYPLGEDYIYPNFGIYIFEGNDNTLMGNDVSNLPFGLWLGSTEHNYLFENTATNCNQMGFRIMEADYNTLERNTATYTINLPEFWKPSGFHISQVSPGVIGPSGNNVLLENVATNLVYGFLLGEGTYDTTLLRNQAMDNLRGFEGGGTNMHYIENIASHNSQCGFSIRASDSFFIGNTITHNGFAIYGHGIWMIDSDSNIYQNNYILDSYRGFEFAGDSNDNLVFNNTIEGSYASLIIIDTSMNNYVYHNNFISETNMIWYGPGPLIDYNYLYCPDLSEGNYWSDYEGDDINEDGIGDTGTPWHFDSYPFMMMYGWLL